MGTENLLVHIFVVGAVVRWLVNPKRPWGKKFGLLLATVLVFGIGVWQGLTSRQINHYNVLNVPYTATKQEIQTAFRRQSIRLHPDRNPNPLAHLQFNELSSAADVLSDSKTRNKYHHFGDYNSKGLVGASDIGSVILAAFMRLILPFGYGLLYTYSQPSNTGRNIYFGCLLTLGFLELLIRLQPPLSSNASLFSYPLLPFEQVVFLQSLVPTLLNAVVVLGPVVGSTNFSETRHSKQPSITTSWTIDSSSINEEQHRLLVSTVAQFVFSTNLDVLKLLADFKKYNSKQLGSITSPQVDDVLKSILRRKVCMAGVEDLINNDVIFVPVEESNEGKRVLKKMKNEFLKPLVPTAWYVNFMTPGNVVLFVVMGLSLFKSK